ncbi:MAG: HEAT repeat domain-containing protein [Labilithrix sp.]
MTNDEAIDLIVAAALRADAKRILDEGKAAGAKVPFKPEGRKYEEPTAVNVAFPSGAALVAALEAKTLAGISAVLQGARAFDDESLLEAALALASEGRGELRRAATFALGASRDDRALEFLLGTFTNAKIPRPALTRSRHPEAPMRVRAIFVETEKDDVAADALETLAALAPAATLPLALGLADSESRRRVRMAALNALTLIKDPSARAFFEARWRDPDEFVARLAIRDTLQADPTRAWTLASALGGSPEDAAVLGSLFSVAQADSLAREPRLVDLAARFRRNERFGGEARRVLSVAPRSVAVVAIERHPIASAARGIVKMPPRRDYLSRYESGEHAAWDELLAHAPAVAADASLREEAAAVARALMKRVRQNADAVRAVLSAAGARLAPEGPVSAELRAQLATVSGAPLPVSLDAFLEVVGTLSLLPAPPDRYDYGPCALETDGIRLLAADPLEIGDASYFEYQLRNYEKEIADSHREIVGPFLLEVAPDYLHKQDISGGPSYALELPPIDDLESVDPELLWERHRKTLVGYLRHAFTWGGFPGLDPSTEEPDSIHVNLRLPFDRVDRDKISIRDAAARVVKALTADVVPF